jgi:hypothetical protein
MTGLIWVIQLVHYPLMVHVDSARFPGFHAAHSSRISWVVGPAMLLQLFTAAGLMLERPAGLPWPVIAACAALTAIVFASTAFLSVPSHGRLSTGYSLTEIRRLVATNWPRTAAWSAHSVLWLYFSSLLSG